MRIDSNDAHRQAAYRKRREGDKHNAVLVTHGKDAARAATDAVILARQLERDAGSSERTDLIELVMDYGEACDFEALRLEDTNIEPGLDAWSAFVTTSDNSMLRLVAAIMQQRQGAAYRRRRLAELGGEQDDR